MFTPSSVLFCGGRNDFRRSRSALQQER
jgi:hypothetical protein